MPSRPYGFIALVFAFLATFMPSAAFRYAALGDSYAAGDGAGSPRLPIHHDLGCGRFSEAYPIQLSRNTSIFHKPDSTFHNLACGGASTTSIRLTQVPFLGGKEDLVTVTVGGNEIDFFAVLNACVYRFYPVGDCDAELVRARQHVQSEKFLRDMTEMVKSIKVKAGGRLLLTGYARFFNEWTEWCDRISFVRGGGGQYLRKDIRARFNAIVNALNDVIQASAEAYGAAYLDIDTLFEGHRFCEDGVREPADSDQTWFFNIKYDRSAMRLEDQHLILPGPIGDFLDMTRSFHPTASGHNAIAQEVARLLTAA